MSDNHNELAARQMRRVSEAVKNVMDECLVEGIPGRQFILSLSMCACVMSFGKVAYVLLDDEDKESDLIAKITNDLVTAFNQRLVEAGVEAEVSGLIVRGDPYGGLRVGENPELN